MIFNGCWHLPWLQFAPVQLDGHWQVNPPGLFTQVPPFWQGLFMLVIHSLISAKNNKFNCINVESNVEYFELIFQVLHSAYTVNESFFLADIYSGCRFQLFEFRVENSHTWNNVFRRCVVSEGIRNNSIVTSEKIIRYTIFCNTDRASDLGHLFVTVAR